MVRLRQFFFPDRGIYTVLFLWLILTAINLNKAYHIDDTAHLEAAEHIVKDPLNPMSGAIVWFDQPTPLNKGSQPPLFYYLIALISFLFGDSEVVMHLFLSVFTLAALYYFKRIADLMNARNTHLLLVLFAFCPAFIVNQNLMADVPILAIILGVLYFTLKAGKSEGYRYYVIASMLLCAGLMMKYSVLPILAAMVLVMLLSGDYRKLLVILIPLIILVLWSVWNIYEFGFIHLLDRPKNSFRPLSVYEFIACLGAVSTCTIAFFYALVPKKITVWLLSGFLVLFSIYVFLSYFDVVRFKISVVQFDRFFFLGGSVLVAILFIFLFSDFYKEKLTYLRSDRFKILVFLLANALFIILYAPFIATRHVLLIIPLILLFGLPLLEKAGRLMNRVTLLVTIALGLLLGISDWLYADFYRNMAKDLAPEKNVKVWTVGHWGWQWYSVKNGMTIYFPSRDKEVQKGDLFIYPEGISRQPINPGIKLCILEVRSENPGFFTFFAVHKFASMYKSEINKPPWRLSKDPIDRVVIGEVVEISKENKKSP